MGSALQRRVKRLRRMAQQRGMRLRKALGHDVYVLFDIEHGACIHSSWVTLDEIEAFIRAEHHLLPWPREEEEVV